MKFSNYLLRSLAPLCSGLACVIGSTASSRADTVFTVRQTYSVPAAEKGAVRGWFWMPEDRPEQKVLDFRIVEAPAEARITRDGQYGRAWIYAERPANSEQPLKVVTEFKVLRRAVSGMADASKARALTHEDRRAFHAELRRDEKHMEVTREIQKIADELSGMEQNPVLVAKKFYDFVIEKSEHYSKTGGKVKGLGLGSAKECLSGTGDTCTDQHALFIALCRARGIPCRLFYGSRLKAENAGKDHDPGYRCWPNFFAPGIGWVPVDVSSGDTAAANKAPDWFGGLDENRLEWAEGRDFELQPKSAQRPDLVIRGWVEVDGKPFPGFQRSVHFTSEAILGKTTVAQQSVK